MEETIEEEEEEPVADESVTEESVFIEDEVSKDWLKYFFNNSRKSIAASFSSFISAFEERNATAVL